MATTFTGGGTTTAMSWMAGPEDVRVDGGAAGGGGGRVGIGPTELDCMWTY